MTQYNAEAVVRENEEFDNVDFELQEYTAPDSTNVNFSIGGEGELLISFSGNSSSIFSQKDIFRERSASLSISSFSNFSVGVETVLALSVIANGSSVFQSELSKIRESIFNGSSEAMINIDKKRIRRSVFDGVSESSIDSELSRERVFDILSSSSSEVDSELSRGRFFDFNSESTGNASVENKLLRIVSQAVVSNSETNAEISKKRHVAFDGSSLGLGDITIVFHSPDSLDLFLNALAVGEYNTDVVKERKTLWSGVSEGNLSVDTIYSLIFGYSGFSESYLSGSVGKERVIQTGIDSSGLSSIDVRKARQANMFGDFTGRVESDVSRRRMFSLDQFSKSDINIEAEKIRAYVYSGKSVNNQIEVTVVLIDEEADEIVQIVTRTLPKQIVEKRFAEWNIVEERMVEQNIEEDERRLTL